MGTWRESAAPIIAEVIRRVGRSDMCALRKALREAYPWGDRRMHPYKVWCSEIRRQLGHPIITPRKDASNPQGELFA